MCILCFHSSVCFYLAARTRSAQISILAPKRVISSNFFRGWPDKFSALSEVFLVKNQQLTEDLPHRAVPSLISVNIYVTDLRGWLRPGELCD